VEVDKTRSPSSASAVHGPGYAQARCEALLIVGEETCWKGCVVLDPKGNVMCSTRAALVRLRTPVGLHILQLLMGERQTYAPTERLVAGSMYSDRNWEGIRSPDEAGQTWGCMQ
jgi:hypothetical protein